MEKVVGKVMFKFEINPLPEDFLHMKFVYSFCIYKIYRYTCSIHVAHLWCCAHTYVSCFWCIGLPSWAPGGRKRISLVLLWSLWFVWVGQRSCSTRDGCMMDFDTRNLKKDLQLASHETCWAFSVEDKHLPSCKCSQYTCIFMCTCHSHT